MPTLTVTKTYANGNVLTETDLDNIKDSIQTFINTTKLDADNIQDNSIPYTKFTAATQLLLVATGTIIDYGGSSAPGGYLLCYGQEVSQTTYSALYAIVGTNFNTGGEAVGNFRIPDLRGRATFGKDDMGGSAANRVTNAISGITGTTMGSSGGSQSVQSHSHTGSGTTSTQSADHTHTFSGTTSGGTTHGHTIPGTQNAGGAPDYAFAQQGGSFGNISNATNGESAHTHTYSGTTSTVSANHDHTYSFTSSTFGSGSSQNMPPALIVSKMIKT